MVARIHPSLFFTAAAHAVVKRAVVAGLICSSFTTPARAQGEPEHSRLNIALTVPEGFPLRLIVTSKVRYKKNEPVPARVVEPVFAFDREVLPAGTEVTGYLSGFKNASRWARLLAISSGNFTPLREPLIDFNALVLSGGNGKPIQTVVSPGTDNVVRFEASKDGGKKGKAATAMDTARQQIESRKRAVIDAVKAPGKFDRIKEALWSFAPYHPQYLKAGARFNATLQSPLDFGSAEFNPALDAVGSGPAADSIVTARLSTALDSQTASHGAVVEAVTTRPLFSADNRLIFPEGSRLHGTVVQAQPARLWHRSGKLAFMFTGVEAQTLDPSKPQSVQPVEGRLQGIEVSGNSGDVKLDEEGGATVAESKKRFIAPAIAVLLAARSTEGKDVEPDNDADDVGRTVGPGRIGGTGNNFGPRILAGGIGFGSLGAVLGRVSQPVASILGFYGAARLVYSNIIGRGQEVTFPKNTPIEIRLGPQAVPD